MGCFCCFGSPNKDVGRIENDNGNRSSLHLHYSIDSAGSRNGARSFTFYELAVATRNFDEINRMKSLQGPPRHRQDLDPNKTPLSWSTRVKIALGAARGLEYLHCKANPPVIYHDLKSGNILLDNDFNPKFSDFGLAKLGPVGDKTHVSTRRMGTYGYCAPEYATSGKLTFKSDIYSFGVVLLELITGRKAVDVMRKVGEQYLVLWSRPYMRDRKKYVQLADALLQGQFPVPCLQHAVSIAAMCLQDRPSFRPLISDIVVGLQYLSTQYDGPASDVGPSTRRTG